MPVELPQVDLVAACAVAPSIAIRLCLSVWFNGKSLENNNNARLLLPLLPLSLPPPPLIRSSWLNIERRFKVPQTPLQARESRLRRLPDRRAKAVTANHCADNGSLPSCIVPANGGNNNSSAQGEHARCSWLLKQRSLRQLQSRLAKLPLLSLSLSLLLFLSLAHCKQLWARTDKCKDRSANCRFPTVARASSFLTSFTAALNRP